jgi:hypothetical protein
MFDALEMRCYVTEIKWDPNNPLNGRGATIRDLTHHR